MTVIDTTGISPADMPLERLEAQITELSGHIAAANARLLQWIAEYDRREGWLTWGCASAAHWLSWKCGDGLHAAREKVRTARALEVLPALTASFAAGELSFTKVRAITRVAVPCDEHEWIEMAQHSTGAQIERSVSAARSAIARGENADARTAFERRSITRGRRSDGLDELKIIGPADDVEVIWAAVEIVVSQMVDEAASGSGRTRREVVVDRGGRAAMRFDALTEVAERAVASAPTAAVRGDVGRLALVIDTDGLAEMAAADDHAAEPQSGEITLSGRRVAPAVAKRWCCDLRAAVVLEHEGHVHDEGRDTRVVNRKLRRALHRRDGGMCRFPGCGTSSWLHAHHIFPWEEGGPTDLDNLVSLCGFHHRLVHTGGWQVAITDGAVVWMDPDGVPVTVERLRGDADTLLDSQRGVGITPRTIESKANDRLDFHFVVSVLAEHIAKRAGT